MNEQHVFTLNTGHKIPIVGLGTSKSSHDEIEAAVEYAIDCGYRHIDCAWYYKNEQVIGRAIKRKINEGKITRDQLFITSKLWTTFNRPDDVRSCLNESLEKLQTNYLDLYLIHFPISFQQKTEKEGDPLYIDKDYLELWKHMEKLLQERLVRNIGVSNFNQYQLNRIIKEASIVPSVCQTETHPYLVEKNLVNFCQKNGILVVAHSPLGCKAYRHRKLEYIVMEDPELVKIAKRLNRSVAQVMLRFQVQRNVAVIPKSVTPSRIASNKELFDFSLTEEDMKTIIQLNKNFRISDWDTNFGGYQGISKHKYYPFREDYTEDSTAASKI